VVVVRCRFGGLQEILPSKIFGGAAYRWYLTDRIYQVDFEELLRFNASRRKRLVNRELMLLGVAARKHAFNHEWPRNGCCLVQLCDALFNLASREPYLVEVWHQWVRKDVDGASNRLKFDKPNSAPQASDDSGRAGRDGYHCMRPAALTFDPLLLSSILFIARSYCGRLQHASLPLARPDPTRVAVPSRADSALPLRAGGPADCILTSIH